MGGEEKRRESWRQYCRRYVRERASPLYDREPVCECEEPRPVVQYEPRGCGFWALVVLLTPVCLIGPLLLLIPRPRRVVCANCGREVLAAGGAVNRAVPAGPFPATLTRCRACGNPCAEDAASCPKCGKPNPAAAAQSTWAGMAREERNASESVSPDVEQLADPERGGEHGQPMRREAPAPLPRWTPSPRQEAQNRRVALLMLAIPLGSCAIAAVWSLLASPGSRDLAGTAAKQTATSQPEFATRPTAPERALGVGDKGRLAPGSMEEAPLVPSKEALNAYVAAVAAGDMTDFTKITGGQFFTVPAGTLVLVVDEAPAPSIGTQFKVRVLEGESAGRSGWLPSKWVEGQTGGAMPAAEARAKQRAHFDKTRGNNADAAMLAKDLSGLANAANCHFSRVYAVLTASKEADNEYSRGGEIARYRQAVQSLRVEVTVDGRTWDSAGRDAQEQLTSAMVAWLHKVYPNATASVRFSDGDRFLGSGRWSRGDQQPALDLR